MKNKTIKEIDAFIRLAEVILKRKEMSSIYSAEYKALDYTLNVLNNKIMALHKSIKEEVENND